MTPWIYVRLLYSIPQMHIATVYVLTLFYLDI